jgi:Peptidase A4 family
MPGKTQGFRQKAAGNKREESMIHRYRSRYGRLCAVRTPSRRGSITVGTIAAGLGLAAFGLMAAGPAAATTTTGSLLAGTAQASVVRSTLGAGYQASHKTFGSVAAQWTVPAINCSKWKPGEVVNFWVGLGRSGSTSERINIFGQCAGGAPAYATQYWINNGANLISYPKAGDKISAAVRYDSRTGKVRFTYDDTTQNQSYNQEHGCAVSCARAEAQVMAGPNGEGQLAPYGSVTFHGIAITSASGQRGSFTSTHWRNAKIYEYDVNNSTLLAASASALSNSGTRFTDTWKNP